MIACATLAHWFTARADLRSRHARDHSRGAHDRPFRNHRTVDGAFTVEEHD
jgi:hypothetical protein